MICTPPRRKNSCEVNIKSINGLNVYHLPCPQLIENIIKKLYFLINFLIVIQKSTWIKQNIYLIPFSLSS